MTEQVLQLGCRRFKRKGAIGLNILANRDAGVIDDLDVFSFPFMCGINFYSNTIHRRAFTSRTFDDFIEGTKLFRYGDGRACFRLERRDFDRNQLPLRRGLDRWLLAWASRHEGPCEECLAFICPVHTVYFELEVVK